MFTGEYDSVLFPGSGKPVVIDAIANIVVQPKNVTELDRLAYIINEIKCHCFCVPKNKIKYVPSGKMELNEGFSGLSKAEAFNLDNWQFARKATNPEIVAKISRGEQTYNSECLDKVSSAFPKNSWSIQEDVTGTLATLKSHLWPGFYSYHRVNTDISGFVYIGDGVRNSHLPFMV
jgi:radial spoke head protein 9